MTQTNQSAAGIYTKLPAKQIFDIDDNKKPKRKQNPTIYSRLWQIYNTLTYSYISST